MDDPAINYTVSDHNVTYGIKHYEKALGAIRAQGSQDYAIRLADHVTNLYLHEIALHSQSNVDDFKGPWIQETFKTAVGDTVLGPEHMRALTACQQSCRNILDTFLSYDFEVIYVLPVIFSKLISNISYHHQERARANAGTFTNQQQAFESSTQSS
jgi:hypothetical protein